MTVEEQWEQEQVKNEHDHHVPTAGAMTGHILANLRILSNKLNQVEWYIKGPNFWSDQQFIIKMRQIIDDQFNQLGHRLVTVNEQPASTSAEWIEYSMLKESGSLKYQTDTDMLAMLVTDIQTSLMFVSRAIQLAQNEAKLDLAAFLIQLQGIFNRLSCQIQARLGKTPLEGLMEDEDDD